MANAQELSTIYEYLQIAQGAEPDDPRQETYWDAYTNILNSYCYTQELRDAWFEYLEMMEEEEEETESEEETEEEEAPPPLYEIATETPPPYNLLPEMPPPYRELPPAYIL